MTRGLEAKLYESAAKRIEEVKANLNRAEQDIYPEYLAQFEAYRKSVLSLLENPENIAVADDSQVISAVEISNEKVISGLSNKAGKEARARKRGMIREASNDNFKAINTVA